MVKKSNVYPINQKTQENVINNIRGGKKRNYGIAQEGDIISEVGGGRWESLPGEEHSFSFLGPICEPKDKLY